MFELNIDEFKWIATRFIKREIPKNDFTIRRIV